MVDQLPKSFHALEHRVADLYTLIPRLVIEDGDSEDLHCGQCQNILIRAYNVQCGHHFCGPCIKKMVIESRRKCPIDAASIELRKVVHHEAEKEVERRVVKVKVQCPNQGCNVVKPIIEILEHYNNCENKDKQQEEVKHKKNNSKNAEINSLIMEFETYKAETKQSLDSIHDNINNINSTTSSLSKQITDFQQRLDKVISVQEQLQQAISRLDSNKISIIKDKNQPLQGQIMSSIAKYKEKKQKLSKKSKLKLISQKFSAQDVYHFKLDIHMDKDNIGLTLKLLPDADDDERSWPLVGKATVSFYSSSETKWLGRSIPLRMDRSSGPKKSALCIPSFLKLQQLEKYLSNQNAFQVGVVVNLNN